MQHFQISLLVPRSDPFMLSMFRDVIIFSELSQHSAKSCSVRRTLNSRTKNRNHLLRDMPMPPFPGYRLASRKLLFLEVSLRAEFI